MFTLVPPFRLPEPASMIAETAVSRAPVSLPEPSVPEATQEPVTGSSHSGNRVMVRREWNGASRPERTGSVASAVRGAVWQGEGIGSVAEKGILLESLTDCCKTRRGSGA
jgi:hypothetical protein